MHFFLIYGLMFLRVKKQKPIISSMKKLNTTITILFISIFLLLSVSAAKTELIRHDSNNNPKFVSEEILVKFEDDVVLRLKKKNGIIQTNKADR